MKIVRLLMAVVAAAAVWGCGHGDRFTVKGEVSGKPSMNLRIVYYTDGKVVTGVTAARDGSFTFDGHAPENALVEIYDNDYRLLGRLVARDGDDVQAVLDRDNRYAISLKGNDISEQWAEFLNSNADALEAGKGEHAIADYVSAHRDTPLSALLVVTEWNTSGHGAVSADSLLSLINPECRASGMIAGYDAILARVSSSTSHTRIVNIPYLASGNVHKMFRPRDSRLSLIAVSNSGSERDSIVAQLRRLSPHQGRNHLGIIDLSVDPDTLAWHRAVMNDSATWAQGWVAGAISGQALQRLGLPRVPYFIVTDSLGEQLWRGESPQDARLFVISRLAR